ncbi:hypothetical protein ACHAXS_008668 [Conticribra weissflogii]
MTKIRSADKAMLKTNVMFAFILAWSIISTAIIVFQHHQNVELQQRLSQPTSSSSPVTSLPAPQSRMMRRGDGNENGFGRQFERRMGDQHRRRRRRTNRKMIDDRDQEERRTSRQVKINSNSEHDNFVENNSFPFTRSLRSFANSQHFFINVVQSASTNNSEQSPLEWSEVSWKDLMAKWGRSTTFSDLIGFSMPILPEDSSQALKYATSFDEKPKMILHCLPKTASTTLRSACREHSRSKCAFAKAQKYRPDPYGYRDVDKFYTAVARCPDLHHYCVQGGDASMTIINYEGPPERDDDSQSSENGDVQSGPHHFVHLVPFRNFDEWAASALRQIYEVDEQCEDIDNLLEHCLGYRELYMELYPKSVLALQIGMALNRNNADPLGNMHDFHQHHIVLYDYKQIDDIMKKMSDYFDVPPMPKTDQEAKKIRTEGTCPEKTLERFHECHDETLMTMDAIVDLKQERKRRRDDMVLMKEIRPPYKYVNTTTMERFDGRPMRGRGRINKYSK